MRCRSPCSICLPPTAANTARACRSLPGSFNRTTAGRHAVVDQRPRVAHHRRLWPLAGAHQPALPESRSADCRRHVAAVDQHQYQRLGHRAGRQPAQAVSRIRCRASNPCRRIPAYCRRMGGRLSAFSRVSTGCAGIINSGWMPCWLFCSDTQNRCRECCRCCSNASWTRISCFLPSARPSPISIICGAPGSCCDNKTIRACIASSECYKTSTKPTQVFPYGCRYRFRPRISFRRAGFPEGAQADLRLCRHRSQRFQTRHGLQPAGTAGAGAEAGEFCRLSGTCCRNRTGARSGSRSSIR
jgi:hypothetical protein